MAIEVGLFLLALWVAYYLVRSIEAFGEFKRGRALHTAVGVAIVRNETMRHGRAIAHANAWRSEVRCEESEALQVVDRG